MATTYLDSDPIGDFSLTTIDQTPSSPNGIRVIDIMDEAYKYYVSETKNSVAVMSTEYVHIIDDNIIRVYRFDKRRTYNYVDTIINVYKYIIHKIFRCNY